MIRQRDTDEKAITQTMSHENNIRRMEALERTLKNAFIRDFLSGIRVTYTDYSGISNKIWLDLQRAHPEGKADGLSHDSLIRAKNHYFLLCQYLNQLGDALKKSSVPYEIPRSKEIKFFRDKVIEHWPDYIRENGGASSSGGIFHETEYIPWLFNSHLMNLNHPGRKELFDDLNRSFSEKIGRPVTLEDKVFDPEKISKEVFALLKDVDPEFKSYNFRGKNYALAAKLWNYCIPSPIFSTKEYFSGLLDKLEEIDALSRVAQK